MEGSIITNESVEIATNVSYVETYITRLSDDKSEDGKSMIVSGRYVDRLDRRNGEWRIAMREFIPHFFTDTDTTLSDYSKQTGWSDSACAMGTWDKRDPSYRRPMSARLTNEVGPACAE